MKTETKIEIEKAAIRLIDKEMPPGEFHTDSIKARVQEHLSVVADWEDDDAVDTDIRLILVNNGILTRTEAQNIKLIPDI